MIWQLNRLLNVTNAIVICERYKVTQTFHTTKRKQYFFEGYLFKTVYDFFT